MWKHHVAFLLLLFVIIQSTFLQDIDHHKNNSSQAFGLNCYDSLLYGDGEQILKDNCTPIGRSKPDDEIVCFTAFGEMVKQPGTPATVVGCDLKGECKKKERWARIGVKLTHCDECSDNGCNKLSGENKSEDESTTTTSTTETKTDSSVSKNSVISYVMMTIIIILVFM